MRWVASGTHAALFWGWTVGLVFSSLCGGEAFWRVKKNQKQREFVKETCLEFNCALFWSRGPLKETATPYHRITEVISVIAFNFLELLIYSLC